MADHSRRLLPATCCALVTSLLLTTGCADRQPGIATAAQSTPSDRHGAPAVRQPLDVTPFLPQPCTVLATDQLRLLDLPAPGVSDTHSSTARSVGPNCTWRNSATASSLGITFVTALRNGLADQYRARAAGLVEGYWIETVIDNYPAIYNAAVDYRAMGNCLMNLGVSDSLTLLIDVQDRSGEKSCDRVAVIASMVVRTLQGKR